MNSIQLYYSSALVVIAAVLPNHAISYRSVTAQARLSYDGFFEQVLLGTIPNIRNGVMCCASCLTYSNCCSFLYSKQERVCLLLGQSISIAGDRVNLTQPRGYTHYIANEDCKTASEYSFQCPLNHLKFIVVSKHESVIFPFCFFLLPFFSFESFPCRIREKYNKNRFLPNLPNFIGNKC